MATLGISLAKLAKKHESPKKFGKKFDGDGKRKKKCLEMFGGYKKNAYFCRRTNRIEVHFRKIEKRYALSCLSKPEKFQKRTRRHRVLAYIMRRAMSEFFTLWFSQDLERKNLAYSPALLTSKKLCDMGLGARKKKWKIMKENGIMVDFEWAYKEVMLSNDFTGKSPAWINTFVEGWRKGYLKGFLRGWTEGAIEVICAMKRAGLASEMIATCTDISIDVVEMVTEAKE